MTFQKTALKKLVLAESRKRIASDAVALLDQVLTDIAKDLARQSGRYAEAGKRSTITKADVMLAVRV